MLRKSNHLLRPVLCLTGIGIVLLGIDNAFGGIATLGWQGPQDFYNVTNQPAFAIRDSHVRFIGGIWLGMGLVFVLSAFQYSRLRSIVMMFTGLIFLGGLVRLAQNDLAALLSADLLPSLMFELVLFPLLALWMHVGAKGAPRGIQQTFGGASER